ncbi:MAG: aminoglycoside phosphotransferase family protein [Candidatus Nanopelagicaceae bacterium]|nr:aminoglycoside phosphotransferase family protein [Candidatus Nanopelagicaceae bacterium]
MNASELLNKSTVVPYLISRGIISPKEVPIIEVLTGGISNVVFAVKSSHSDLVLKQALPELIVPSTWQADQRRTLVEARAIEVLRTLTPENVPKLINVDTENFVLVIERVSHDAGVWKDDLLNAHIDQRVAQNLGSLLGSWHRITALDKDILEEFQEDQLFEQLRITPFYREISIRHPDISYRIAQLISDLEFSRLSLVHGDFSPKNILVDSSCDVTVLDYEVAHTGNPVFDLAFLLAHLFCKSRHFPGLKEKSLLKEAALTFISNYEDSFRGSTDPTLGWHIAAIALARVDGVSQVHYLSLESKEQVRSNCIEFLNRSKSPTINEMFT